MNAVKGAAVPNPTSTVMFEGLSGANGEKGEEGGGDDDDQSEFSLSLSLNPSAALTKALPPVVAGLRFKALLEAHSKELDELQQELASNTMLSRYLCI